MLDDSRTILYIGKAGNLKKRGHLTLLNLISHLRTNDLSIK